MSRKVVWEEGRSGVKCEELREPKSRFEQAGGGEVPSLSPLGPRPSPSRSHRLPRAQGPPAAPGTVATSQPGGQHPDFQGRSSDRNTVTDSHVPVGQLGLLTFRQTWLRCPDFTTFGAQTKTASVDSPHSLPQVPTLPAQLSVGWGSPPFSCRSAPLCPLPCPPGPTHSGRSRICEGLRGECGLRGSLY